MSQRFPIRFNRFNAVFMRVLGITPTNSYVEVGDQQVSARMAYGFRASFPRRLVAGVRRGPDARMAWGAHGWAGRWLVNGAGDGIVQVTLARPVRAYVLGWPIRLRELSVSMDQPDALMAALGEPARPERSQ